MAAAQRQAVPTGFQRVKVVKWGSGGMGG